MDFPSFFILSAGLGSGDGMDLVWCRFVAAKLQRFRAKTGGAGFGMARKVGGEENLRKFDGEIWWIFHEVLQMMVIVDG